MIHLTRLKGEEIVVNVDLIKLIESTPDTLLTLSTGDKLHVRESVDEVIHRVIVFKREIYSDPPLRALELP